MNRDTRFKPIKVNGPGTTGARVYGLVKIGPCAERIEDGLYIQKPSGEWVRDDEFIDKVLNTRVIASGTEWGNGDCIAWLYNIYAVPRRLLRGYEEYVREWVREEDLPSRHLSLATEGIHVVKREMPDGSIRLDVYVDKDRGVA
mgnify:FL=1